MNDPFEQFILAHGEELLRLAYTYTNDVHKSEEIVQHVFYKTYPKHQRYDTKSSVKVFLYHAVLKRTNQSFKGFTSRLNTISKNKLPVASISSEAMLAEQVFMLPLKLREVIVLYYDFGFTQDYIATLLKLPISTVNSRLVQARKILEENGFSEPSFAKLKQSIYAAVQQEKFMSLSLVEKIVFERPSKKQRFIKISAIATAAILLLSGAYFTPKAIGHFKQFNETVFTDQLENKEFATKINEYMNAVKLKDSDGILQFGDLDYMTGIEKDEYIKEQLDYLYTHYEHVDFKSFTVIEETDFGGQDYMPIYVHYTYKLKGDDTTYIQLLYGFQYEGRWILGEAITRDHIAHTLPNFSDTLSLEFYEDGSYAQDSPEDLQQASDLIPPLIVNDELTFFVKYYEYRNLLIFKLKDEYFTLNDFNTMFQSNPPSDEDVYTIETIENRGTNPYYVIKQNGIILNVIYLNPLTHQFSQLQLYSEGDITIYDINQDGIHEVFLNPAFGYGTTSFYTVIDGQLNGMFGLENYGDANYFPLVKSEFTEDGVIYSYKDRFTEKKWIYQFTSISELQRIDED